MTYVITREHNQNCCAVAAVGRGDWDTPWYLAAGGKHRWLSSVGDRRGRHTCWVVLRCNNPNCLGECIVPEGEIALLGTDQ